MVTMHYTSTVLCIDQEKLNYNVVKGTIVKYHTNGIQMRMLMLKYKENNVYTILK